MSPDLAQIVEITRNGLSYPPIPFTISAAASTLLLAVLISRNDKTIKLRDLFSDPVDSFLINLLYSRYNFFRQSKPGIVIPNKASENERNDSSRIWDLSRLVFVVSLLATLSALIAGDDQTASICSAVVGFSLPQVMYSLDVDV